MDTIKRTLIEMIALAATISTLLLGAAVISAPAGAYAGGDQPSLRLDHRGDDGGGDDNGGDDNGGDDNGGDNGGGDDDRVILTGACQGGGDWKLKVKTDDGRLEVEGEVDVNTAGQRWAWTIRHNGSVSARGTGTTNTRSGSFEVERKIVNLAGVDRIVFRATREGRACRGVVNY